MVLRQSPPEGSEEEQLFDSISSKNLKWPVMMAPSGTLGSAVQPSFSRHRLWCWCLPGDDSQQAGHLAAGRNRDEADRSSTLLEISPPGLTPSTQNMSDWHQQPLQRELPTPCTVPAPVLQSH